jgi:glutamate--cysteine ligase
VSATAHQRVTDLLRARAFRAVAGPLRVGAEVEFLVVNDAGSTAPLGSPASGGTLAALLDAGRHHGWRLVRSPRGAPRIRLPQGGWLSFEPGGQLEYASAPAGSAALLIEQLDLAVARITAALEPRGWRLLGVGIDPERSQDEVRLQVPTERYRRMDEYFEAIGPFGRRMMRQTAAVQINVDPAAPLPDAWRIAEAAAPLWTALFANSTRYAGSHTGMASFRAECWRQLDPSRTGLVAAGPNEDAASAYARFALRAPVIMEPGAPRLQELMRARRVRDPEILEHLTTLFPEVRPRGFLEIRSPDGQPLAGVPAVIAGVAACFLDERALGELSEIVQAPDSGRLERAGRFGLSDPELAGQAAALPAVVDGALDRLGAKFLAGDQRDRVEAGLHALLPPRRGRRERAAATSAAGSDAPGPPLHPRP